MRAHGDADIGGSERRRVVDAIADHGGREKPLLAAHGIDLVRRHAVGEHSIEVERGADGLRGGGVIAGDHDDACDARRPQHADRMRCFGAQFVGQEQRPDGAALDRDEHHQGRPPGGAADDAQCPIFRLAMGINQIARTGADVLAIDDAVNTRSHGLVHVARQRQRQAAIERGLHDGARQQ